ncbi:lamin tail domain-containing protein [Pontiellaceae bacterium B1224]|nr:lamin tail domain-containing protein [Pontiellaceae bacterium B1224]
MKHYKLHLAHLFFIGFMAVSTSFSQNVWISEIVADNGGSLEDEDGDSPDWIELHNTSDSPVDLTGWYLTDTATNLVKWQFPATSIAPEGFLIVFASDKNRAVAGAELHSNFKLSASGESVLLVQADGSTVEHSLTFPSLDEDVSYGYRFESSGLEPIVLLETGAPCTAHIPTSASDAAGWQEKAFDDSEWLSGTTGVGYDEDTDYTGLIGLNVMAMQGVNQSVYIRVPFSVESAEAATSLNLKMKYDDGFAAYINGDLVASANVSGTLAWDSGGTLHSDDSAVSFVDFDLTSHISSLNSGANILAIHGLNKGLTSSDLIFMPKIEATFADGDIDASAIGMLGYSTPGTANANVTYLGDVETPVTTPARGFHDSPFQVSVSNVTPGATIRYTTDGSEPTESSPEYTGPITISATTCFRVRSFAEGWKPSFPRTDTYIFVDDVANRSQAEASINGQSLEYGMDSAVVNATYFDASNQVVSVQDALKAIPTISLTTDDENLYDPAIGIYVNASQHGWEVPASAELINPDGSEGFHINAGLRIRGGASRTSSNPKHSFRLFFRKDYGAGKLKFPLFEEEGVDEFDKVDLRSAQNYSWSKENNSKNTFLRDVFARDTAGAMGQTYTRSRYYHLYLNGEYWGLFMTEERPVASFAASYFGGDKDDYDAVKVIGRGLPDQYSIEVTDGTLDAYNRLYAAAMAGFTDDADYFAIQGLDANGEPDATKEKLLDVDNLIDYLLVLQHMAASDNCITWFVGRYAKLNNMYAVYNRVNPDGFKWIQHDSEHSLDTYKALDFTGPFTNSNFTLPEYFNAMTLHDKLIENAEYRIKYADRVYESMYNDGVLVRTNCEARLDFRAAQIDRAIVANAARWGSTELDRDTWVDAVATTRAWFSRSGDRCNEVIGYLDADGLIPSIDPPLMSRAGGRVDSGATVFLSAGSGTIYYTTDGTDPRAIGGGIAGSTYTGSISITRPTHLMARCRATNGEWSALAEETYWTPEIPLAVTELMYHAPDGNPYDFIEVKNISDETISLQGYKFDNAISFKFKNAAQTSLAPGEFLVAVDDIDSFNAAYPGGGISIAGEFSGDFSNSGEKVDLEFRNEDLISFTYDDARNWPQAADGAGHSLVPLDSAIDRQETGSLDYGGNWRASTYLKGSPGYPDPEEGETVLLNEITAHTDTGLAEPYDSNDKIELYNPTGSDITLNGWYLSDDLDELYQWEIPSGTVIPADGYIVFDENNFHPDRISGFGLDKAGELVVLTAPGRVVDVVRFKGQENTDTEHVSWGRYPDGSASWITTLPTLGSANVPVAATIQISELMYNPIQPGNDFEYIQIQNLGSTSHTFENATGAYRIDGGVEFDFPAGTTLPAGEILWILSFNPTNSVKLDLFCSAYGLDAASETFIGGYSGSLSDRGERVAIERPQDSDDPLKPLDISWVVVDELFYFDQSPWPVSADGTGYPLMRTGLSSWNVPDSADIDSDLMSDQWETLYFKNLVEPDADPDLDGQNNLQEYIAGTIPTDNSSYFAVQALAPPALSWNAVEGRTYTIFRAENLNEPFVEIATVTNSPFFDSSVNPAQSSCYYRITAELVE